MSQLATAVSAGGPLSSPLPVPADVDCSWKPFGRHRPRCVRSLGCGGGLNGGVSSSDKSNYKQLLGAMDYSFLCAYAVGMYLR